MIDKIKAALWKNGNFVSKAIMYMIDYNTRVTVNVSQFLKTELIVNEKVLDKIIKEQKWMNIESKDIRAIKILDYVKNRLTYTRDRLQYGTTEHWATLYLTVILLAVLSTVGV